MEEMITTKVSGAELARNVKEGVAAEVAALKARGIEPTMAVVIASESPAALSYLQSKQKLADTLGISMRLAELGPGADQAALNSTLRDLSSDPAVHGILVEYPLRKGLDINEALLQIEPHKDVDGLTPANMGLVASAREDEAIASATAQACVELAETKGPLEGKQVGIIGRGRTVGRPLIGMLTNRHATLTVTHSLTPNLFEALKDCEVVFVAIGQPRFIGMTHLQKGQIVIDVGINVLPDGSLVGDVDAESVDGYVGALTPVPGGVGPLTSAIIFRNLIKAIKLQDL